MKYEVVGESDWLVAGMSEQEINAEKALAILSAEIELKQKEMGMTQKEFAKFMGVTQGMISRWESGTYNFTISSIVRICEKLNLKFNPVITPCACRSDEVLA